jgi:hypothetical protein
MPLFFDLLCFFVHETGIDVIHYCCLDIVGLKRVGLKRACRVSVVGVCGF